MQVRGKFSVKYKWIYLFRHNAKETSFPYATWEQTTHHLQSQLCSLFIKSNADPSLKFRLVDLWMKLNLSEWRIKCTFLWILQSNTRDDVERT